MKMTSKQLVTIKKIADAVGSDLANVDIDVLHSGTFFAARARMWPREMSIDEQTNATMIRDVIIDAKGAVTADLTDCARY